jgi:hypothetical protein
MFRVEFKTSITKKRTLTIDGDLIQYDDQQMSVARVTGFAYGRTFTEVRFVKLWSFHFRIQDSTGREIKVEFNDTCNSYFDEISRDITNALWHFFGSRIMNETIAAISGGRSVNIGGMQIDKTGFTYTYKPWFRKERTEHVGWNDVEFEQAQHFDMYFLKSKSRRKTFAAVGLAGILNGHVLAAIIRDYQQNALFREQLTGKQQISS